MYKFALKYKFHIKFKKFLPTHKIKFIKTINEKTQSIKEKYSMICFFEEKFSNSTIVCTKYVDFNRSLLF